LGSRDKATLIFDLNEKQLAANLQNTSWRISAGTKVKLPQHNAPALLLFAVLMAFLTLVGLGWLLQPPPQDNGNKMESSEDPPGAET